MLTAHVQRQQTPPCACGTLRTLTQIQRCQDSGLRSSCPWRCDFFPGKSHHQHISYARGCTSSRDAELRGDYSHMLVTSRTGWHVHFNVKQDYLQGHPEEVYGCEFLDTSAGSAHLASCSAERVYLWDIATGRLLDSAGPPLDIRHEPAGSRALLDLLHARSRTALPAIPKLVHCPPSDIACPASLTGCVASHILVGGSWPICDLKLAVVCCT